MTWASELVALWRDTGKATEPELRISNGRAYIETANRVLAQQSADDPDLKKEAERRNIECMDIADKLRATGNTADALTEILALASYPLPDMRLVHFYGAAYHAGLGNHAASAEHRLAYIEDLDNVLPWQSVYQGNQRSKDVSGDFATAITHLEHLAVESIELATAYFCHAVSLGKSELSKTKQPIQQFRKATSLASAHTSPALMQAIERVEDFYLQNQTPLDRYSKLDADKEYCCLRRAGLGDAQTAEIEFYGVNQPYRSDSVTPDQFVAMSQQLIQDGWQRYAVKHFNPEQSSSFFFIRPKQGSAS